MSILHTKFLIHWTGNDFHQPQNGLKDDIRNQYTDRLIDILQHGFFMNPGNETIWGANDASITGRISRTCFTEIKLSLAKQHATKYGSLGIGVNREYVLERYGGPVFYVQNGSNSNIIENFCKVLSFLDGQNEKIKDEFAVICGYLKNMGEKDSEDLCYYDELEWRITHLRRLDEKYVTTQDANKHIYRIKIKPVDIKVIVFPDIKTKNMTLMRSDINKLIDNPICVTLDDCQYF